MHRRQTPTRRTLCPSPIPLRATFSRKGFAHSTDAVPQAADPSEVGQWSEKIPLANVPIHTHVLPTGKVLFWGRRNPPGTPDFPFAQPARNSCVHLGSRQSARSAKPTSNQPTDSQGNSINLFCSGHTFLADGRLLVTGGHLFDSQGLDTSTFYDPFDRQMERRADHEQRPLVSHRRHASRRTSVRLFRQFSNGPLSHLINANTINNISQVLENGDWNDLTDFIGLPLFPALPCRPERFLVHVGFAGHNVTSLRILRPAIWHVGSRRHADVQNADYAPSVMYDVGKVIFIGGGSPTNIVETIDLNAAKPAWAVVAPMKFRRRQHNATLLPDGTVFVTGGTQGNDFDDLDSRRNRFTRPSFGIPSNGTWTQMAPEAVDRCYHSDRGSPARRTRLQRGWRRIRSGCRREPVESSCQHARRRPALFTALSVQGRASGNYESTSHGNLRGSHLTSKPLRRTKSARSPGSGCHP